MLRRVRPMIRYGGAVCIALGLATGPARAEAGTTAPQIELVISAVADPDASGSAYVELRLLRPAERRVGKESVRTCRTGWSTNHQKTKKQYINYNSYTQITKTTK